MTSETLLDLLNRVRENVRRGDDALLARLGGVRQTGPGRWIARCPAHNDHTPSLSVAEGDRAILVKCWAGCEFGEIVEALGMAPRDLFYDRLSRSDQAARRQSRDMARVVLEADSADADRLRLAEQTITTFTSVDPSRWTGRQVDAAMTFVSHAHHVLLEHDRKGAR